MCNYCLTGESLDSDWQFYSHNSNLIAKTGLIGQNIALKKTVHADAWHSHMGYLNNISPTLECKRSATNITKGKNEVKKHRSAHHLAFRQLDRQWKIHPIERSCEMESSCENAWIAWVPARPIPSHIDSCRQMKDVKWDIREKCKHAEHYCPWSSISPLSRTTPCSSVRQ